MFVCFSRCLYCGRRTPHEVCHRHGGLRGRNRLGDIDRAAVDALPTEAEREAEWSRRWERSHHRAWRRWFDAPPEECTDPACPLSDEAQYA
jgi:hypothetical protein